VVRQWIANPLSPVRIWVPPDIIEINIKVENNDSQFIDPILADNFHVDFEKIYIPNRVENSGNSNSQTTFRLVTDETTNSYTDSELDRIIKKVSIVDPGLASQLTEDDLDFIDSNITSKLPDNTDKTGIEEELFGDFDEFDQEGDDLLDFDIK
jgi:vesicle coat complex subunit